MVAEIAKTVARDAIILTAEHSTYVFTPAISVFYPHTAPGTQI